MKYFSCVAVLVLTERMPAPVAAAFLALLAVSGSAHSLEPLVGLPCEGCEAVFEGMPASIPARSRIAGLGEPGEPMKVSGRVFAAGGEPKEGVVVYAYQTNAEGVYPVPAESVGRASDRHGALRGWARTDVDGRYHFDTIRPASYPGRGMPAHIHLHVIEPGCSTYYIDDIVFTDDPLLTPGEKRRKVGRAGDGIVTPVQTEGTWHVTRDIELGRNVPGYSQCGKQ